jgi:hypothetical protein
MNAVVVVALQAYLAQQTPLLAVEGRQKRQIVDQPPQGYPRPQSLNEESDPSRSEAEVGSSVQNDEQ